MLEATSRYSDGISITSLRPLNGRSIIGVPWHPEFVFYLPSQLALFHWLLRRAK
jgi:putative glutamine amidotransferase